MTPLLRKMRWWLQRRRREQEMRDELQFHLDEEVEAGRANGLSEAEAARAARRDLGNALVVREDARAVWSWVPLEQLGQDVRYGLRGMRRTPLFTALAALSLALGIGANTAIYSFMEAILLRSLPVADPATLVIVKWRSRPLSAASGRQFVMHSIDGTTYDEADGLVGGIFPFPAFELLQSASAPVLSSLFAHKPGGHVNVIVRGEAELATGEFVSGNFFQGLGALPAAGRLLQGDDDRAGAPAAAVLSLGYSRRRFGDAPGAVGRTILVNNVPFTVVGVAPTGFFGVDPAAAPQIYLPMHSGQLLQQEGPQAYTDQNYYWLEIMGRLKPGVDLDEAQALLARPFAQWVASTAATDAERSNLPALHLEAGAAGLDSLRRLYSKPLYVLLTMTGLILAIACANTANLLLARAAARTREMTVRLSLGAGRWRVARQLLTESVLLAGLSGVLGVFMALAGVRALTGLLANGQEGFTLRADLNWRVLLVTLVLSLACGLLFGVAPALRATRPALMQGLRGRFLGGGARLFARLPRVSATQALVVAQFAVSLVLLVAAGLFVRTLSNLQSMTLGFNREHVLLFSLNAPQAGLPEARVADFYGDLRSRLSLIPGVRSATLSHASLIRAGRGHPITVNGQSAQRTRVLWAGPRFFTTMQIPIVRGREIDDSDRQGTLPVAVVSQLFAKTYFGDGDAVGRSLEIGGSLRVDGRPQVLQIVGVAANARYGGLKREAPAVVYVSYAQVPAPQMGEVTYALRTDGDPLGYAGVVRETVRQADARVPLNDLRTQTADIDQTINQEIVFARLCGAFAILALTIACVGLYATMAYGVARRTSEIGLRMALGAGQRAVTWMVLREGCVLAAAGLAIAVPAALAASRLVESFLFGTRPNDPQTFALAAAILLISVVAAGYPPAWRASRVDPMVALRLDADAVATVPFKASLRARAPRRGR